MLFEPLNINDDVQVKNRLVFPPITTGFAAETGIVSEKMCTFYEEKAKSGLGMVIVEAAATSPGGKLTLRSPGIWDESFVAGLSRVSMLIKNQGAVPVLQLAHAGFRSADGEIRPVGPSPISLKKNAARPYELSKEEIKEIIAGFVRGAERAYKAGFAGIELHCAHFYLLSSFLSSVTNRRNDEYGGNVEGKSRIVREIIQEVKGKVDHSFILGCRINGSELAEEGINLHEAVDISRELERSGADMVHVSAYDIYVEALKRFVRVPALAVPRKDDQPGTFVPYAEKVRQNVNIPVISVGKINRGDLAEEIVSQGKSDLVAIGRPLIADPQFINKMINHEPVQECKYCLFCLKAIRKGEIKCKVNPAVV